jgi:tetratricopeptide (TPR) repeat protein
LALINLGKFYYYQNEMQHSNEYMMQSLQIADQLKDPFNSLSVRVNLAALKHMTGEWREATAYYAQAASLAAELGNAQEQAGLDLNRGVLYFQQGDHEAAFSNLTTALALGRKGEICDVVITALAYLAELHLADNRREAAQVALAEAESLATTRKMEYLLPFVCYVQALYALTITAYPEATAYAERAIEAALRQGMGMEEGQGWRALGQIQLALHQPQQAVMSFERSLALLTTNPYEAACTRLAWGQALLQHGDVEEGMRYWQTARANFQSLGAQRKLATVDELLGANLCNPGDEASMKQAGLPHYE